MKPNFRVCLMGVCCWFTSGARAVLFYETDSSTFNTTAPTGALANSGWQYEGNWGVYLGTAIAPNYFVTAKHVGGSIGQQFHYAGQDYTVTAAYPDPNSDLQIWKVDGEFASYASLYTGHDEAGKSLVVIGRGTQRGTAIGTSSGQGWYYGASDTVQRWGQNTVARIADLGAGFGLTLEATFDSHGGPNEAHLSTGDSGGAVFIQENGTWKLAGINYAVNGPFSSDSSGANPFYAALWDMRGLYVQKEDLSWTLVKDPGYEEPSAFFATRISSNLDWIQSVAVPEPFAGSVTVALGLAGFALWRRSRS